MSNVHQLGVKPKQSHHKYKRYDITVTYIPIDKEFKWSFKYTTTVTLGGRETSADLALHAAKAEVDHLLGAVEDRDASA